ncbi:MAG TPA: glycosyltransferase family A protein [Deltaproteobacteria bacterium]|nr:glycosyltransferase family A protein [Deltaproteobacteria bacterium]
MHENNISPNVTTPRVTVLMPVCNGQTYVREAMDSVIAQTYQDWEFLIVDDGSTDDTPRILNEYRRRDNRIRIVRNPGNMGISMSLNTGISLSSGKFIARMDADDISLPERIGKQVNFLDRHPSVGVCGTWVQPMGGKKDRAVLYPRTHDSIVCTHLFNPAIAHPSVMMRRETLEKHGLSYSTQFPYAQDYEFWVRCSHHTRLANIDEVLLILRQHENKISEKKKQDQSRAARRVQEGQLREMGLNPNDAEMAVHEKLAHEAWEPHRDFLVSVDSWLSRLITANARTSRYPEPAFSTTLAAKWFSACTQASRLGLWTLAQYVRSPLSSRNPSKTPDVLKFMARCILRRGYWRDRFTSPPS